MMWSILAVITLAQFLHYFFDGDMAWYVGWSTADFTIFMLAGIWAYHTPADQVRLKTALIVFTVWQVVIFAMNLLPG